MNRRRFLYGTSLVCALGLAGCAEGSNGGATEDPGTTVETTEATETTQPTPTTESPTETETPSPTETETPTETRTETTTRTPTETTAGSSAAVTVEVGPDGSLRFRPQTFEIVVGDTVEWVWRSGGHNVKVDTKPSASDWSGTEGGEFDTFDAGYTYRYTFETAGEYEYYCGPHRSAGMVGSFTVTE